MPLYPLRRRFSPHLRNHLKIVVIDGQVVVGFNRPRIDQLLAQRAAGPPRLGAAVADAGRIAAKKGTRLPAGAYVGRVDPGSAAAQAGVQAGDVVVQLAGQAVGTGRDVDRILAELRRGQTASVAVWRNGRATHLIVRF